MQTHYPLYRSSVSFLCSDQINQLIGACKVKEAFIWIRPCTIVHTGVRNTVFMSTDPVNLCLLQSTWPQPDSLLESSMWVDWQWAQPGQRPESSGASWPSHPTWDAVQNRCPLTQPRRAEGTGLKRKRPDLDQPTCADKSVIMIRLMWRLFKNSTQHRHIRSLLCFVRRCRSVGAI